MSGPELSCGTEGRSGTERLCTSPITAQFGVRVAHEVTDEAFAAGRGEGVYEAVCGCVFVPAPLVAAPGRPCLACLRVLAAARGAAAVSRRSHRRRRRGGLLRRLGQRQRAGVGKDIAR